jgi:putative ABC transport system ATP-binding protein
VSAIVECQGVFKHYRQGELETPALRGVDLTIQAGDFASIAGPSGSGKTTLLNVIGGLDHPSAGEVIVDGVKITGLNGEALADLRLRKIGFVFQAYNLIPVLSALENVEFILQLQGAPADERRARAMEVLSQVGLEGLEDRRPARLSGGQQQRVAVARALASRPAIVLADEPTANLDSATATGLIDLMAALNVELGMTFLISTHDERMIERTRRRITLTDGRITADARDPVAADAR